MKRPGDGDRDLELRDGDAELRGRLRALRVDPPEGSFGASLHRRLAAAGVPEEVGPWRRLRAALSGERRLLWPALGVATAAALLIAVGFLRGPRSGVDAGDGSGPRPAVAATSLPATKVAVVRVNLSANVAVETAQIRVSLPDGLFFWADGQALAQRSFEWTQPLQAGDNDIPIAVRGQRPGRYVMTVSARIGDQRIHDEVLLEVVDG